MRLLLATFAAVLSFAAPAAGAPTWLPPSDLQTGAPDDIDGAMVETPGGTRFVAWVAKAGLSDVVRVRVRPVGSGFGSTITLSSTDGRDAHVTDVAVDGAGVATVVWDEDKSPAATERQLRAARVTPTGAVDMLPPISPAMADAHDPAVAVNGAGRAVVAYLEGGATQVARALVRDTAAGGFGDPETLSSPATLFDRELEVAVADDGTAVVAWSRKANTVDAGFFVEAADRGPSGDFGGTLGTQILSRPLSNSHTSTEPSLGLAPNGSGIVVFQESVLATGLGTIRYSERDASGTWSSDPLTASPSEDVDAFRPVVGVTGDGTAIAAWFGRRAGDATAGLQGRVRAAGGAGFGPTAQISTAPGFDLTMAVNRAGDALLTWSSSMADAVLSARRSRTGQFGAVQTVTAGGGSDPAVAVFAIGTGIDDEGNGSATWSRNVVVGGGAVSNTYEIQSAAQDAAPPRLTASIPAGGVATLPVGMAATATDRLTASNISWNFGDGGTATGGAVSHAFGTAGAFNVTVTATDAVGNTTATTAPVLVATPPPPPRIDSAVSVKWGRKGRFVYLVAMRVVRPPAGTKVQLRCNGKKCPFKRKTFTRFRNGSIRVAKELKPAKVVKKKSRRFRRGQRLQLRITADGFIGKVVTYPIPKRGTPTSRIRCLPIGATKPQRTC